MVEDESHPKTAKLAIKALSRMGMAAFPQLSAALIDTNHPFRGEVIASMGFYMPAEIGTNRCLLAIQPALHDPHFDIRVAASNVVERLTAPAVANASQ